MTHCQTSREREGNRDTLQHTDRCGGRALADPLADMLSDWKTKTLGNALVDVKAKALGDTPSFTRIEKKAKHLTTC